MTPRERTIFLRGIAVGMNAAVEFETGLEQAEAKKVSTDVPKTRKKKGKGVTWTPEEDQLIRDNGHMKNSELAVLLPNRNAVSIMTRKVKLGVRQRDYKKEPVDNGLAKLGQ